MEISFHSHLESNKVIATKLCRWQDSCAVVACAKICRDLMGNNGITARRIFYRIWIAGKKTLVKRAPGELVNARFTSQKTFNMYSIFISWHHHVTTYPWILKYLLKHSCPSIKCVLLLWVNSKGRHQNSNQNTEIIWHDMQKKYSLYWI